MSKQKGCCGEGNNAFSIQLHKHTRSACHVQGVARCSHQKEYNNRTKITPYPPMKWYDKTFLLQSWALCTGFSQLIEKAIVHLIKRNRREWYKLLHYPTRFNIKQIFNIFTRRGLWWGMVLWPEAKGSGWKGLFFSPLFSTLYLLMQIRGAIKSWWAYHWYPPSYSLYTKIGDKSVFCAA